MSSFVQWNLRGFTPRFEELKLLVRDLNPICFLLQETMFLPSQKVTFKGFNIFRSDSPGGLRANGGAAILLSEQVPFSRINLNTNFQAVAVRITIDQPITVCSVYLPPSLTFDTADLESLLIQLPEPYLICGDINSHSRLWNNQRLSSDVKGKIFEKLLQDHPLQALNDGTATHFSTHGTFSAVDVTFASDRLACDLLWSVMPDRRGSDHNPIHVTYKLKLPSSLPTGRWKIDPTLWPLYRQAFQQPGDPEQDIDSAISELTQSIHSAADLVFPKSKPTLHFKVPWWNKECAQAVKKRKQLYNLLNRNPTLTNIIELKKQESITRRILKQTKRNSWTAYISSLTCNVTSSQMWQQIKRIRGNSAPGLSPLKLDGTIINDSAEIAECFGQHFHDISSNDVIPLQARIHKAALESQGLDFSDSPPLTHYNAPFSQTEFSQSLEKCRNSSPGPDTIPYVLIQHMPISHQQLLLKLYNKIWTTHAFPAEWKNAILIPIPKPGKDKTQPESYRPISLTNCLCKILERMVNQRLTWFIETNHLLSPIQCGARKGHQTQDHLVRVSNYIQQGFIQQMHTIGIYFDVAKAYDKTWRHGILATLHKYGMRGNLPIFIQNLISDRTITVRCGSNLSSVYQLENSIQQGSPLSGTLFNLAINSISALIPPDILSCLYCDDFGIFYQSKDLSKIQARLMLVLQALEKWSMETGFNFSQQKTVMVHFCRKRCQTDPTLHFFGTPLVAQPTHKFLGLLFDRKLTWAPHIVDLRQRALKSMNILKSVSHHHWGADRKTLLTLYHSLIRSKLDYGSSAYGSASSSLLESLEVVHRQALRICTGAFKSSPKDSLLVEANEPSLAHRRNQLMLLYHHKITTQPHHVAYDACISTHSHNIFSRRPRSSKPFCYRVKTTAANLALSMPIQLTASILEPPPWCITSLQVVIDLHEIGSKSNIPPNVFHTLYKKLRARYPASKWMHIFTDGSKLPNGGVSSAFLWGDNTQTYNLQSHCSVYTAEMYAILQALEFSCQKKISHTVIFTDSLSAALSLKPMYPRNELAIMVRNLCHQLHKVVIVWIPSHIGITENELVDKAAKEAASSPTAPLPFQSVLDQRLLLKFALLAAWQQHWHQVGPSNKLNVIKPSVGEWHTSYQNNRSFEVALARLRIGHTRMTHGFLMCNEDPPLCSTCQCPDTISHIFTNCTKYVAPLQQIISPPAHPLDILRDHPKYMPLLHSFLQSHDLLRLI